MNRKFGKIRAGLIGALVAVMLTGVPAQAENTENSNNDPAKPTIVEQVTVTNAGFDQPSEGSQAPSPALGWAITAYHQDRRSILELDQQVFRNGTSSLKIQNKLENDTRVVQVVPVKPDALYLVEAYVKTEGVTVGRIGANLSVKDIPFTPVSVTGTTSDWQLIKTYIMTEPDVSEIELTAGIGGYGSASAGTMWIDDLTVSQIDRMPMDAPLITVQSAAKRQAAKEAAENQKSSSLIYWITFLIMAVIAGTVYWLMRKPKGSTGSSHSTSASPTTTKSVFYEEER